MMLSSNQPTSRSPSRQTRLKTRADSSITATRVQQIQNSSERRAWSRLLWRTISVAISVLLSTLPDAPLVTPGLAAISVVMFVIWSAEEHGRRVDDILLHAVTGQSESKYVEELDSRFLNLQYDFRRRASFRLSTTLLQHEPLIWVLLQATLIYIIIYGNPISIPFLGHKF
jgi:hypothetical protein